jgi:hypothetical protein
MAVKFGSAKRMRGSRGDDAAGGAPAAPLNALQDENGNYILDENGNYILSE